MQRAHKIYRIVINAYDRIFRLDPANNNWYNINVGEIPLQSSDTKWQWAVESFLIPLIAGFPSVATSYYVDIPSLPQPNSYSTITNCENTVALTHKHAEHSRFLNFDSVGCPLRDLTWMRSGRINIRITNALGQLTDTQAFIMVLVVWEIPRAKEYITD
jgi:hypothetical protein